MGFIFIAVLGIVGAGLMASGIVLYRKSDSAGTKALAAAFTASGAVMWGLILFVTPTTTTYR